MFFAQQSSASQNIGLRVSKWYKQCVAGSPPLLGPSIVRLAYIDEAGINRREPALAVAGILVDGDRQSMEIEKRLDAVKRKHIPEPDWDKVIFHATHIYHGQGYFDRKKPEWSDDKTRWAVLDDLASIVDSMMLPVIAGVYQKATFGLGVIPWEALPEPEQNQAKKYLIHATAAIDCILWADRWLAMFAMNENAIIVAEDNDYIKRMLKFLIRVSRKESLCDAHGMNKEIRESVGLPLKRIIDAPYFAAKEDAPALQLADVVAFTVGRFAKDKPVHLSCADAVLNNIQWIKLFTKRGAALEAQPS